MKFHIMPLFLLMLLLAACGGGGNDNNTTGDDNVVNPGEVINWDRDASTIIFRAEVTGGSDADALYRLNEVPPCTIYGNGRVVWSVPREGASQILFDTLEDPTIRSFISDLTVEERIYTYGAEADLQLPSEEQPIVEQVTVFVNDRLHVTDSFSDWDPDFFVNMVERCQSLGDTPTIYEPTGAWIAAAAVPYQIGAPVISWDREATGLDLQALANSGTPVWSTDRIVAILWNVIHASTPDLQFADETGNYQIAVQVPGITVNAPPAPES
ncbi:MAG: hypothetical protein OHK0046_09490 [Anaerolineae bacterium]